MSKQIKKELIPNYDLQWLRKFANYSQQEVDDFLKVNRVTYANWERGESNTPKEVLPALAKEMGVALSSIPSDLAGEAKRDKEAVAFVAEVAKATKIASPTLVAQTVALIAADSLPVALPQITIPLHQFRPSVMKKFNVPVARWREFVVDKRGEDAAALEASGYSWDQAVEWVSNEARASSYALLLIWGEARDKHFKDRIEFAQRSKLAMPPLEYSKIVAIFDTLLDERGWGLV